MNKLIAGVITNDDVEEGELPEDQASPPDLTSPNIKLSTPIKHQEKKQESTLNVLEQDNCNEEQSSEIIFETVFEKNYNKQYDYSPEKKRGKKIHKDKQDIKSKNSRDRESKPAADKYVEKQRKNEKRSSQMPEKEQATTVPPNKNTIYQGNPQFYHNPYMFPTQMSPMGSIPPIYPHYPAPYIHPNQQFSYGNSMTMMPPMTMPHNPYPINASHPSVVAQVPSHMQYKMHPLAPPMGKQYQPQPEKMDYKILNKPMMQNNSPYQNYHPIMQNQQSFIQNPKPQHPPPNQFNPHPYQNIYHQPQQINHQNTFQPISNPNSNLNSSNYQNNQNNHQIQQKAEKIMPPPPQKERQMLAESPKDKKKDFLEQLKKESKRILKNFGGEEQEELLQIIRCVVKYHQLNTSLFLKIQQDRTSKQEINQLCYENNLCKLEKIIEAEGQKAELVTKLLTILQLKDILLKIKERKVSRQIIGIKQEIKVKLLLQKNRDPRKISNK